MSETVFIKKGIVRDDDPKDHLKHTPFNDDCLCQFIWGATNGGQKNMVTIRQGFVNEANIRNQDNLRIFFWYSLLSSI